MKAPGIYTEGKTTRHPVPPLALGGGGQGREDSETPLHWRWWGARSLEGEWARVGMGTGIPISLWFPLHRLGFESQEGRR